MFWLAGMSLLMSEPGSIQLPPRGEESAQEWFDRLTLEQQAEFLAARERGHQAKLDLLKNPEELGKAMREFRIDNAAHGLAMQAYRDGRGPDPGSEREMKEEVIAPYREEGAKLVERGMY